MNLLKNALGAVLTLLLCGGYFASTAAQMTGQGTEYIHRLDQSGVPTLSLALLICIVVFLFIPPEKEKL